MSVDLIVHGANVAALFGGAWALVKVVVPVGISIRDALHDTAHNLKALTDKSNDHEERLRDLEYHGIERRTRRRKERA